MSIPATFTSQYPEWLDLWGGFEGFGTVYTSYDWEIEEVKTFFVIHFCPNPFSLSSATMFIIWIDVKSGVFRVLIYICSPWSWCRASFPPLAQSCPLCAHLCLCMSLHVSPCVWLVGYLLLVLYPHQDLRERTRQGEKDSHQCCQDLLHYCTMFCPANTSRIWFQT